MCCQWRGWRLTWSWLGTAIWGSLLKEYNEVWLAMRQESRKQLWTLDLEPLPFSLEKINVCYINYLACCIIFWLSELEQQLLDASLSPWGRFSRISSVSKKRNETQCARQFPGLQTLSREKHLFWLTVYNTISPCLVDSTGGRTLW